MITDINKKNIIKTLNRAGLSKHDYWRGYFGYEYEGELHSLTKCELTMEVNNSRPFVDSQVIISAILTRLGERHNFHRQFNERFHSLHKEQVLGMQLYHIMIDDSDTWIYCETQHQGHMFPHATYFQ